MKRVKAQRTDRRAAARRPAAVFTVVAEGKITEPDYLRMFGKLFGNRSVRLKIIGGAGDPRSVVESAIEELRAQKGDALGQEDTVWAMFDRDVHPRFKEALDLAAGNSVPVAVSNPCFELWGIFHYQDFHAPVSRHECQRRLEGLCLVYDRHSHKSFASMELIGKYILLYASHSDDLTH